MKSIIYYFSGRGNSLHTARCIAEQTGAALLPIRTGTRVDTDADAIGIVTPVIDIGIPSLVRRFAGTFPMDGPKPYLFAVLTCGGLPGDSLGQLKRLLARRGHTLGAGFTAVFGLNPPAEQEWADFISSVCRAVESRQALPLKKAGVRDTLLTALANPLARAIIPSEDKKFTLSPDCTGCGTCVKVCPAGNIRLENGKPLWLHRCAQCAACFCWCPAGAIGGSNLAARTRYANPHVSLEDMLRS